MSLAVKPQANIATPPNPWGSCFDAAAHNLLGNFEEDGIVMCHGVGIANKPGEEGDRIGHAWLEFDCRGERVAFDPIWLKFFRAEEYRKELQISYCVAYSKEEFMRLWTLNNFPGPWDEQIKQFIKTES